MKLEIVTKNALAGEKLTETIGKKLGKLDKYFSSEPDARIVIKKEKSNEILEVSILFQGTLLRAEEKGKTAYDSIDKLLPKLEKQIVKHREKFAGGRVKINAALPQAYEFVTAKDIDEAPEIVKTKTFAVKPIDVKEAVAALELVDHDFYLYLNEATGKIEAVYRRTDGKIGRLIPEVK